MKKSTMTTYLLGSALALTVLLSETVSSAEVLTAASGSAWSGSDDTCIRRDWGRAKNNSCSGQRLYTIGVRAIPGTRTFKAHGRSGTGASATTSCAAIVTDLGGWNIWWTGHFAFGSIGSGIDTKTLGSRSIASNEGVVFECYLGNQSAGDSFVGTVEY